MTHRRTSVNPGIAGQSLDSTWFEQMHACVHESLCVERM